MDRDIFKKFARKITMNTCLLAPLMLSQLGLIAAEKSLPVPQEAPSAKIEKKAGLAINSESFADIIQITEEQKKKLAQGDHYILLEFWATWCGPCVRAIPHINELSTEMKDEKIIFISISKEKRAQVEHFLKKQQMKTVVVLDSGALSKRFGVRGIPRSILLDPKGNLAGDFRPTELSHKLLTKALTGEKVSIEALPKLTAGVDPTDGAKPLLSIYPSPMTDERRHAAFTRGKSQVFTNMNTSFRDVLGHQYRKYQPYIIGSELLPKEHFAIISNCQSSEQYQQQLEKYLLEKHGLTLSVQERELDNLVLLPGENFAQYASQKSKTKFVHVLRKLERLMQVPLVDKSGLQFVPKGFSTYGTAAGLDQQLLNKKVLRIKKSRGKYEVLLIEKK